MAGFSTQENIQKRLSLLGVAMHAKEVLVAWRCCVGPEYWDVCCEDTGRVVMSMVDWLALDERELASQGRRPGPTCRASGPRSRTLGPSSSFTT